MIDSCQCNAICVYCVCVSVTDAVFLVMLSVCIVCVCLLQTPCFWPSRVSEPENTDYGMSAVCTTSHCLVQFSRLALALVYHITAADADNDTDECWQAI